MQNFAQRLTAARKAQKLTQDQLAKLANVSRPTVSHWENGRSEPDLNTILVLNGILHCDLAAPEENDAAQLSPAEEASLPAEGQTPPAQEFSPAQAPLPAQDSAGVPAPVSPRKSPFLRWILLTVALCLLAGAGLGIWMHYHTAVQEARQTPKADTTIGVPTSVLSLDYDLDWYLTPDVPEEGKSYVRIYTESKVLHPVRDNGFDRGRGWYFTFHLAEQHGVPFTAEKLVQTYFCNEKRTSEVVFSSDMLANLWGYPVLYRDAHQTFAGAIPLQSVTGIGIMISGHDENGHSQTFHGYVALSPEMQN